MENKLYIDWAKKYVDVIDGKYYAAYACRAFAMYSKHIWPSGPFDTLMEAKKEARSHLCDDDSYNVLLRKNNKWWRPENGLDIKSDQDKPRLVDSGFNWVETE